MKTLVEKMNKLGLLKFVLIFYAIITIALALALPITIIVLDVTLLANPIVLGMALIAMLFFGTIGYFTFIRPYIVYRNLPEVLAETDGEFLYIHGKKEGKIPLASLSETSIDVNVPYLFQPGFLREFIIHIFSSNYGDVILDVPDYGEFKLRFVANAEDVARQLVDFIANETSDNLM